MKDHLPSYHKRLLTEISLRPSKASKIKPAHSFFSPINNHYHDLPPQFQKSLTKYINPAINIVKNFKIISSKIIDYKN